MKEPFQILCFGQSKIFIKFVAAHVLALKYISIFQ